MQAQPQSTPAARIPSLYPSSPPSAPIQASTPAPNLADTTGLAHDAGNLLAALGLYCDLLSLPGVLRPEHQHYATELRIISDGSSKLIQRLLALPVTTTFDSPSNTESADTPELPPALLRRRNARATDAVSPTRDHATMVRNLAPVLQRIASGAAQVIVASPPSLPPLSFPTEIIERIIVNLVRNAAEAIRLQHSTAAPSVGQPEGEIHVALAVVAGRVHLTIEDNGPGMPSAIASAYLQPTPLPDGATRGLGHRIVHQLVTASAGQLSIRVRPGHGTIFCIKWTIPTNSPAEPSPSDANSNHPEPRRK
ncbi:MAG: HAMP domain-containing sensor histidine kinase [Acidobacteriaceae bacterium]